MLIMEDANESKFIPFNVFAFSPYGNPDDNNIHKLGSGLPSYVGPVVLPGLWSYGLSHATSTREIITMVLPGLAATLSPVRKHILIFKYFGNT